MIDLVVCALCVRSGEADLDADVTENNPQNQQEPSGTIISTRLALPDGYLLSKASHMICATNEIVARSAVGSVNVLISCQQHRCAQ